MRCISHIVIFMLSSALQHAAFGAQEPPEPERLISIGVVDYLRNPAHNESDRAKFIDRVAARIDILSSTTQPLSSFDRLQYADLCAQNFVDYLYMNAVGLEHFYKIEPMLLPESRGEDLKALRRAEDRIAALELRLWNVKIPQIPSEVERASIQPAGNPFTEFQPNDFKFIYAQAVNAKIGNPNVSNSIHLFLTDLSYQLFGDDAEKSALLFKVKDDSPTVQSKLRVAIKQQVKKISQLFARAKLQDNIFLLPKDPHRQLALVVNCGHDIGFSLGVLELSDAKISIVGIYSSLEECASGGGQDLVAAREVVAILHKLEDPAPSAESIVAGRANVLLSNTGDKEGLAGRVLPEISRIAAFSKHLEPAEIYLFGANTAF